MCELPEAAKAPLTNRRWEWEARGWVGRWLGLTARPGTASSASWLQVSWRGQPRPPENLTHEGGWLPVSCARGASLRVGFSFHPGQALCPPGLQQATEQAVISQRSALKPDAYPGRNS